MQKLTRETKKTWNILWCTWCNYFKSNNGFFASTLLLISGLKIIAGILLLWIGVKLILDSHQENTINVSQENNLLGAVKTIIIADFIMSLDNSVAIAAAADGNIYLVIFGLLLSVPIIIWGSKIILKFIDKYPIIIFIGSALLGWIAGGMIQTDILITDYTSNLKVQNLLPLIGSIFVIAYALIFRYVKKIKLL